MVNNDSEVTNETGKKPPKEVLNKGTPYEEIQIYDTTCNKIRTARNFKLSSYEEKDEKGKVRMKKSVEFIIVGNNRTWKMFVPYEDFKKSNPSVHLPGDSN